MKSVRVILLVLVVLAAPTLLLAESLSETEQRIVDWVDANAAPATELLKEAVDIPSGTLNVDGVRAVGEVFDREFRALGLTTRWVDMPAEMKRAGHLFANKDGKGKKILMIGHLDTVFEIEDGVRPFARDGDIARGHGVYDMKAGNVIIVFALRALQSVGELDDLSVVVALTGDEEKSGRPLRISRRDLVDAGKWADIALGFEEAMTFDDTDWATVARRSSSRWVLTVNGKQAHSSDIFNDATGAGAIFEAARILNAFYDEVRGEEHLTFNAGTIQGGTEVSYDPSQNRGTTFGKTNVVARSAIVHGGIRALTQDQLDRARKKMLDIVSRNHPRTDASIEFSDGYPPMAPTAGNLALQRLLSDINVALGRNVMPALDPSRRGAADISFVAPYTDALAGLGGIGGGGHTPDEYIELSSLSLAIKRAALLIYRLQETAITDD